MDLVPLACKDAEPMEYCLYRYIYICHQFKITLNLLKFLVGDCCLCLLQIRYFECGVLLTLFNGVAVCTYIIAKPFKGVIDPC